MTPAGVLQASPDPQDLRDGRLRILFIPDTETSATSERTPTVLRTLRQKHDVVGLRPPWDRIIYSPARAKWPRALLYLLDKVVLGLRGVLLARRHGAEVVFCETAHHAVAGLVVARIRGLRCVWDSHGNGRLFYESLGKSRRSVRLITAFEKFLGKRVDGLITVSPVDADAYSQMGLPPSKIHVIPLCVNLRQIDAAATPQERRTPRGERPTILFFGSFGYEPNREALVFVNDVLAPDLERRGIDCEIRIAGRDIPEIRFHPLIRPLGFVPDIYTCIRDADLCIVPVRRGVGVLTKVIDSMAVGTPLVVFEFATRGIPEVHHGVHAYVAKTNEEFLEYVARLLVDPEAGHAMRREARRLAEQRFDWDAYSPQLDAIVRGTTRPSGGADR